MLNRVKVPKEQAGTRIEVWLKKYFEKVPYSLLQKILRKKLIKINGKRAKNGDVLALGNEITYPIFLLENQNAPSEKKVILPKKSDYDKLIAPNIIFENPHFLAINKAFGLASQGGSKVKISVDNLFILHGKSDDVKPSIVHRLDKDTTGVMLLAKSKEYAQYLSMLFREREIDKIYFALVVGKMPEKRGTINLPLLAKKSSVGATEKVFVDNENGREAITEYETISYNNGISLLKLRPLTGRTHQLRVHLSFMGNPILGDGKYGGREAFVAGFSNNIHLHCGEMSFYDIKEYDNVVDLSKQSKGKKIVVRAEINQKSNLHFAESLNKLGFLL